MGNTEDDGEVGVPVEAIQITDQQVMKKLPPGTQIHSIKAHGASLWMRTARLEGETNGQPIQYFLKMAYGERGRMVVSGEFVSMTAIHKVDPTLVPAPIAWGTYEQLDDVHFFLCEFRGMTDGLPDINKFPARMAGLHRNGTSPNGKFGFPVTTYHGETPIEHGWSDTWEEYFTRTTRVLVQLEQEARGSNEEIVQLAERLFEKVVPRLLRPLETGGRSIRPSLIHGDLWHGNASTDSNTNEPIIFDAASFYAHNEYELAVWRQPWNEIKGEYRSSYCKYFPPSQPEEDFEDRGALYSVRVNMLDSILYKDEDNYREMVLTLMRSLVSKFPGGYEEYRASHLKENKET